MLPGLYLSAFFVSLLELVMFYEKRLGKNSQNRMILFIVSFIANYGCAFQSFATIVTEAICGMQIYFIGNTLTFVFLFFVIADICTVTLHRYIERFLFGFAFMIMVLVGVCNHNEIFLKNMRIDHFQGAAYLIKDFGPFYYLYPVLILATTLASIGVILWAIRTHRKVSKKTVRYLFVILLITDITTIISIFTKNPIEIYPFINIFLLAALLVIFSHAQMYDMTENLINVYSQRLEYGYITFDKKKRFLGCNKFALKVLPQLNKAVVDDYLDTEDCEHYSVILNWIDDWIDGDETELKITSGNITAMATVRYIRSDNRNVGYLVEMRDVTSHQKYLENLEGNRHYLELEVAAKSDKIVHIQDSIITGIASMVESRDNSTGDHIRRTSEGVRIFIDQIKKHKSYDYLGESFCINMIKAAPMHDLGKIAVHDAVLQKPGKFVPEEYEEMKIHTTKGAEIVANVLREVDDKQFKQISINVAHYHHEKWDGSGYPSGLKGEEIPIEARIMAFADVFDALVTKRCYKEAYDYDTAFEIMKKDFGSHFDPDLGRIFLECKTALVEMYRLDALLNKN